LKRVKPIKKTSESTSLPKKKKKKKKKSTEKRKGSETGWYGNQAEGRSLLGMKEACLERKKIFELGSEDETTKG